MQVPTADRDILRGLGEQLAVAAADPQHAANAAGQAAVLDLRWARPPVYIYQEPWHELNGSGELDLHCTDGFCRGLELGLRRTLYKWRHYRDDTVLSASIASPAVVRDSGFGIREDVRVARTDDASDVVSREYHIQIREEADAAKILTPQVSHDAAATAQQYDARCAIFDGLLPVRPCKTGSFWFAPWDELVRWTGVEEILLDMALRPDYVHHLMDHFVTAWLARLEQYEALDLLERPASELWGIGAAQIFSEVSPAMHEEFALQHERRWFNRWGLNYYGCCEPLHHKVDVVRRNLPNLRKISMSPWVDFTKAVANLGNQAIFAWKPNPAIFATESWDPAGIRQYLRERLLEAKAGGCVIEIHLKDISTVQYRPERLFEWAAIAREVTAEVA
ncbi:MAG: hypothetical protein IT204_24170 [Fimbriimonadaceae bacterium]|nr:hypothetical protein [Fimbriimonadaceae bacterium]